MTRPFGFAALLEADGQLAAINVCEETGSHTLSQLTVFTETFSRLGPGLQVCYATGCKAARGKRAEFHFSWGREPYTRRLGAVLVPAHTVSVYLSEEGRALGEVSRLGLRQLRRWARRRSRPGVRAALRRWRKARSDHEAAAAGQGEGPVILR